MNTNVVFLPEYTYSQLTDCVAMKLDYFKKLFNADNIWEGLPELCRRIEEEPRNISTIILEAKKNNGVAIGGSSVTWCHTKLTRIYILLYYKHRDADIYKVLVFPELLRNMGIYSEEQILNKINREIDKIIELDKMVEDIQNRKKDEPLFAFKNFNGAQRDRLFDEYSEEKLFREIIGFIKALNEEYGTHHDVVTVWYNAKQVVKALSEVRRPELYIERVATALVHGQMYNGYEGSQIILICVYAMIRSAKGNAHFAKFIEKMESYSSDVCTDMEVIRCYINKMKKWCESEPLPFDDYDYIGEYNTLHQTFTSADIERIKKQIIAQCEGNRQSLVNTIEEQKSLLGTKDIEIKRLKYEYSELEKTIKSDTDSVEHLDHFEQLGIDERIIFFCSALRADITGGDVNQTQLANFIVKQTGDKLESVRPRIGKIAKMQKSNHFTDEVKQAAKNVIDSLNKCFKKNPNLEVVHLNKTTSDIIDDIEEVFKLSEG